MTAQTEIDWLPGVVAIADPHPTGHGGPGGPVASESDRATAACQGGAR